MSQPRGLGELMRQAQVMQKKIAKIQEEIGEQTVEGDAGGGMVRVVANGKKQIISIHIEKEVCDPEEIGMLQDLIAAATNVAIKKAGEMMDEEMGKVTGGMQIPGMF